MSISNVGQRFTAVNLQSGKNVPHPTVGNTSNATDIKTKLPGTVDTEADKTNKRLQALQEGLKQLESMPSPKRTTKQNSANRVGFLQRRLEALKMLLLHASPEQAKSLARELKSIAGELSSAAQSLGGSAGGSGQGARIDAENTSTVENAPAGATEGMTTNASAETDAIEVAARNASPLNLGGQISDAEQKPESKLDTTSSTTDASVTDSSRNDADSDEIDAGILRGLVIDAKKMLKEVIDMLKPKLAEAGKEAKKDLFDAEKKLSEVDSSLQENASANVYTGLGGLSLDAGSLSSDAVSGLIVNVLA